MLSHGAAPTRLRVVCARPPASTAGMGLLPVVRPTALGHLCQPAPALQVRKVVPASVHLVALHTTTEAAMC
jgi:hypothetical protein